MVGFERSPSARWLLLTACSHCCAQDLLYSQRNYAALATTIHALAAADATVLFSYPVRHGEEHLFVERLAPAFELVSPSEPADAGSGELRLIELVANIKNDT